MSDLVEWLTKILDEDEAGGFVGRDDRERGWLTKDRDGPRPDDEYLATHIGMGWVLADIAAKRAIIARCRKLLELAPSEWEYSDAPELARAVLHDMATAYADRPGYHFNGWQS